MFRPSQFLRAASSVSWALKASSRWRISSLSSRAARVSAPKCRLIREKRPLRFFLEVSSSRWMPPIGVDMVAAPLSTAPCCTVWTSSWAATAGSKPPAPK